LRSYKFVKKLNILTEGSTAMGIEELIVDQAKKEGIEKGIEKGELSKAKSIARAMKNDGISIEQIAKFTGLSVNEIEKL
jgi:predicted transposase/invertase (TIGR01784 family)